MDKEELKEKVLEPITEETAVPVEEKPKNEKAEETVSDKATEDIAELEAKISETETQIKEALEQKRVLEAELNKSVGETLKLSSSAINISEEIAKGMDVTQKQVQEINDYTSSLFHILDELTFSYFSIKNISAASKSVTEYTQMYNTKFSYYNELRRIALGYVVGIDSHLIHNENMRVTVEKIALQNSNYWLTYALSAFMLWVNDEHDAASRAIQKALDLNYGKASLYFLLVNLRFNRIDASRMWFLKYLDRFDISKITPEWQYLLQAYLYNAFGKSINFQKQINKYLDDIVTKVKAINVGYERKVANQFRDYISVYPHNTKREFVSLSRYVKEYDEMINLLTLAEKNFQLATYFTNIYGITEDENKMLPRIIEDILYDLINSYDDDEYELFKKIKLNEAIVQAKGDITIARKNFEYLYENDQLFSFDELLLRWALVDKDVNVNIRLRRLALDYLNEALINGAIMYQDYYRSLKKKQYEITIDEYKIVYEIGNDEEAYKAINKYYSKSFLWNIFDNKVIVFSLMICLASLACLAIVPFYFNLYALIVGMVLFVTFALISSVIIVNRSKKFNKRKETFINQLEDTLKDFDSWNDCFNEEDQKNDVLKATIGRFKNEGSDK